MQSTALSLRTHLHILTPPVSSMSACCAPLQCCIALHGEAQLSLSTNKAKQVQKRTTSSKPQCTTTVIKHIASSHVRGPIRCFVNAALPKHRSKAHAHTRQQADIINQQLLLNHLLQKGCHRDCVSKGYAHDASHPNISQGESAHMMLVKAA